eukprot:1139102-Pelagomonas_calceolata.AAC.3
MRQIEPVLQGEPVRSLLVQPLAADEKVVGAILTINKNDCQNEHDIFFEDCYTEVRWCKRGGFMQTNSCWLNWSH